MLSQASRVIALDNTCCYVLTGVNLWRNITSKSASVSRGYSEERASMLLQIDFFFLQQRGFYSYCIATRASKPI